jgi:heat shock protein HtpX
MGSGYLAVLVYNRVAWNRRKAFLLPLAALAVGAPLMLILSLGISMCLALLREVDAGIAGQVFIGVAGLMAAMFLVLWGMVSNEAQKLLGILGAHPASEREQRILENLSIGAGLAKPRLFVVEGGAPNAFAIGNPGRAIIGVTRAAIELLDHRELEGVLAHELSHIGNRDTQLNEVLTAMVLLLRLPTLIRARRSSVEEQTRIRWYLELWPNPLGRVLWLLLLPVWFYFLVTAPLMGVLMRGAVSRDREFLADADAALLTRYPEGLIRALAKIRGAGSLVDANAAVAHFYFAEAVTTEASVFATHPPVDARIARLMEIHGEVSPELIASSESAGAEFARRHPPAPPLDGPLVRDELSLLNMGNVMGKVYRVLSPACVYDKPDAHSAVLAQVSRGELLVVFDDPGPFRQVLTSKHVFGYLPLSATLEETDMLPAEIVQGSQTV